MRINNLTNIYESYAAQQSSARVNKGESNGAVRRDSVAVSSSARSFTAAFQAIVNAPDIREDLVAGVREQIENGTYPLDASRTADAIIR